MFQATVPNPINGLGEMRTGNAQCVVTDGLSRKGERMPLSNCFEAFGSKEKQTRWWVKGETRFF